MKKILIAIALAAFTFGCSKDDGGDNGGGSSNQDAAVLTAPANNEECASGNSVSVTQSSVTLSWNEAPGTQKYFLYIKNLATQNTVQFSPGTATSYTVTLDKATPYSWYVSAVKNSGGSVPSATWKFYVAGDAVTNYAPFPADLVSPEMSSSVYGPTIALQWSGSDPDHDITEYKVYFGTDSNPQTLLNTVTTQSIQSVPVSAGNTYYWKVVTFDDAGNSSSSAIFQFKVI